MSDISMVRLYIQDEEDASWGILPDDTHFSNDDIQSVIDVVGSWQAACPALCRVAAMAWARRANSTRVGDYWLDSRDPVKRLRQLADDLEKTLPGAMAPFSTDGLFAFEDMSDDDGKIPSMFGLEQWETDWKSSEVLEE